MGKKMTRAGMELRRAIRADVDANPAANHLEFRRRHGVSEGIIESALTKTVAEWDALIAATPEDKPNTAPMKTTIPLKSIATELAPVPLVSTFARMPGIEQGVVKFMRKPAKMGTDYIFWIPRVYVKNGLVDPACKYDVYLRKVQG
ncbi:MAG: hypothetical protein Q6353_016600 [Candidatus Sigynarchaeum springense]